MALLLKSKKKQEQFANYEQQAPQRDLYFRQANPMDMQGYVQENAYNQYAQYSAQNSQNMQNVAPVQPVQQQVAQPTYAPQQNYTTQQNFNNQQYYNMGYYQNQANQFMNNGWNVPQNVDNSYNYQQQYQNDMMINQAYDYSAYARRVSEQRSNTIAKKKNVNADMIKIVVTIMVVVVAICGMLIANQFISSGAVVANSQEAPAIDPNRVASAVTANGTEVINQDYTIPAYEYEQSTNWFDKLCDMLGGKLN